MGLLEILATAGQWVPALVTVASAITAATPTPKDDAALRKVLKFFRLCALNVGKARPADEMPDYVEKRRGVKW